MPAWSVDQAKTGEATRTGGQELTMNKKKAGRDGESGGASGARRQEGSGVPGEQTWGASQLSRERPIEQRASADRRIAQRRRPDEALRGELQEILTGDPELDASEIEVAVEGGAVTLRGTVDSSDARLLAEELVESVTGVREVHNQLKVAR
jgi:osmotically-inducible protein OsmY